VSDFKCTFDAMTEDGAEDGYSSREEYLADAFPIIVVLSFGYAEVTRDGEIVAFGQVIDTLDCEEE
jgi:hypothetical protein